MFRTTCTAAIAVDDLDDREEIATMSSRGGELPPIDWQMTMTRR